MKTNFSKNIQIGKAKDGFAFTINDNFTVLCFCLPVLLALVAAEFGEYFAKDGGGITDQDFNNNFEVLIVPKAENTIPIKPEYLEKAAKFADRNVIERWRGVTVWTVEDVQVIAEKAAQIKLSNEQAEAVLERMSARLSAAQDELGEKMLGEELKSCVMTGDQ